MCSIILGYHPDDKFKTENYPAETGLLANVQSGISKATPYPTSTFFLLKNIILLILNFSLRSQYIFFLFSSKLTA